MERGTLLGRLSRQLGEVVATQAETARTKSITLVIPTWMGHRPGQHVDVRLTAVYGYQAECSYSIASPPEEGSRVTLTGVYEILVGKRANRGSPPLQRAMTRKQSGDRKPRRKNMDPVRVFAIISWIALPTVMFGGYSLLGLLARGNPWLTPFRATYFRAGHAHAGVLLVMSLVYYTYLAQTTFSSGLKLVACLVLLVGVLAQSGGFFWHMLAGKQGRLSMGNVVTIVGALLLAFAALLLAYGLIAAHI